eukprot:m.159250 g.159250  ORF g.159250 m.159250 type:complete len:149 (-) comp13366_c4_seq3:825-1271(-)
MSTADGTSNVIPTQCSALRKGGHVVIKEQPCKIVDMSTSKTGKHGHAKVHMVAINIFNGKKLEDICPSTHNMNVPVINRKELQVIDINDEGLTVMDDSGDTEEFQRSAIKDETFTEMMGHFENEQEFTAIITSAMGTTKIMDCKKIDV